MWYNLDNIRGRLDDIYIIKLVERRNGTMVETRFLVCDSYQRVKIGTDVSLIHKFAVVLDGAIVGVYDDIYDAEEAIRRFGHVWEINM
jgi:hypothetical protein